MNNNIKLLCNENLLEENELNNINISCISNKLKDNYENEIVIEENYSLNNDVDNMLMNKNYKIETAKYLSDIGYINKMISPESSENENIMINNDNNNKINKRFETTTNFNCDYEFKENNNNRDKNESDLNEGIKKIEKSHQNYKSKKINLGAFNENNLFKINISKHKICKNILKEIGIKKEEMTKEKLEKIRNIFLLLDNESTKRDLLKVNFQKWKHNINYIKVKNQVLKNRNSKEIININNENEKKYKELNLAKNSNINSIKESEIISYKNPFVLDKNKFYSILETKANKVFFEERLKKFRLYLINYFTFSLQNKFSSDD